MNVDPRKRVERPEGTHADLVRLAVHDILITATSEGCKATGVSGASFVLIGLGTWIMELAEVEPAATAKMLRALADYYDPASPEIAKTYAETRRKEAVDAIFAAADLDMAKAEGSA